MELNNWGAFTIGCIVAVFLFVTWYTYDKRHAGFAPTIDSADRATAFRRNFKRSYNLKQNIIEIFHKPSVGVSVDKEGCSERLWGLDGIRALVFLWVLAYEINYLLTLMNDDYAASKWGKNKLDEQFFWKVALQGYEALNMYLVLSAFLFTYANINMCYAEYNEFGDEATVLSKYLFMFCRRVVRIWPALATAVMFVGFMFPYWINTHSSTLDHYFLDRCEKTWWTNVYFVSNFWNTDCFLDLWAVSLNFQLAFLVPLPAYLYSKGDTKRFYAYVMLYTVIVLSLGARLLSIYLLSIEEAPVTTKHSYNSYYLQKMPWSRAGEYCLGILCCFSVFDEKEGEPPHLMDIYRIGTEKLKTWLYNTELLFSSFLQTATIGVGFFFLYEGTLQRYTMTIGLNYTTSGLVLVVGDLVVASMFSLLLKWCLSVEYGSWLKWVLSSPFWHPLSTLSYSAFLFQLAAAFWAVEALEYHGHSIKTGYRYFSKVYFTTLAITLGLALLVNIFIEKPLIKLADSHCVPATPNPFTGDNEGGDADHALSTSSTRSTVPAVHSSGSPKKGKPKTPKNGPGV